MQCDFQLRPELVSVKDQARRDGGQIRASSSLHDRTDRGGGLLEAQLEISWRSGLVWELGGWRLLGLVEVRPELAATDVVRAPLHDAVLVETFIEILPQPDTVCV